MKKLAMNDWKYDKKYESAKWNQNQSSNSKWTNVYSFSHFFFFASSNLFSQTKGTKKVERSWHHTVIICEITFEWITMTRSFLLTPSLFTFDSLVWVVNTDLVNNTKRSFRISLGPVSIDIQMLMNAVPKVTLSIWLSTECSA